VADPAHRGAPVSRHGHGHSEFTVNGVLPVFMPIPSRQRTVTLVAVPGSVLCGGLIGWLLIRYF
jgi:hypothetical protein